MAKMNKKSVKKTTRVVNRRSDEEILQAAMERVEQIKHRMEMKKIRSKTSAEVKFYKKELVKVINRMKTMNDIEAAYHQLGVDMPEMPVMEVEGQITMDAPENNVEMEQTDSEYTMEAEDADYVMESDTADVTYEADENTQSSFEF